ncbi:MAG: SLC13 family permease [Hungatella sp.]|nr:SLC13 family permease [Hungatella sp.]
MKATSNAMPGQGNIKYPVSKVIHSAITIFLMFLFGRIVPPFGGITPVGMNVLGVFLGVIYGYCTCEIAWPSVLGFVAYGLSGAVTVSEAISAMMGQSVVFQSICAFLAAGALSEFGFSKWFVRWSLSRKIFKGNPLVYLWSFMAIFGLSAVVIYTVPLQVLLYTIWLDISESCGYGKNSKFSYAGFTGILLACTMGDSLLPYTSWKLGLAQTWSESVGGDVNLVVFGMITVLIFFLAITAYVLLLKPVLKVDFSKLQAYDTDKMPEETKYLRPRAKRVFFVYMTTVVTCIVATALPAGNAFKVLINSNLTNAGMYAICAVILMIIPSGEGDGQACLDFKTHAKNLINWNSVFMCAVCITLASAVSKADYGISAWLSSLFEPLFGGDNKWVIMVVAAFVGLIMTQVGSNIAFGSALIPIIAPFVIASGLNPIISSVAVVFFVQQGYCLPGSSSPAAIYHSHDYIPDMKQRIKFTTFGTGLIFISGIMVMSIFYCFM